MANCDRSFKRQVGIQNAIARSMGYADHQEAAKHLTANLWCPKCAATTRHFTAGREFAECSLCHNLSTMAAHGPH